MIPLLNVPLDHLLPSWWGRIDRAYKLAFIAAACVSLLAFGFEMTNLTLHHDDLNHLMVQKPLVGYYLGRFVNAWLFFYVQQGHFTPFFDMTIGMLLMCTYGVLVGYFWGARRSLDIALVAMIICVFPYMANAYQYNAVMIAYPLAHLFAAAAVLLSTRGRVFAIAFASVLFFIAFSIYQAVLANAATIFLVWLLTRVLFVDESGAESRAATARSTGAALAAVIVGGVLHVLAVSSLNIPFDSAQGADQAFNLRSYLELGPQLTYAAATVLKGSRAFYFWPEPYLPQSLKLLQQLLLAGAAICCLALPRGVLAKAASLAAFALAVLSPRALQFLHPQGTFHELTLTAYALVIAAAVMVIMRTGRVMVRNVAVLAAALLVVGYVMQCGWISTVSYLNTLAHYSTVTQILAHLRSLPDQSWDGKTVAVVGRYEMPTGFPFRPATGVATSFMDPYHMNLLARLMRDEVRFMPADASMSGALAYAATHKTWPSPDSVAVVDGVGVVVLSNSNATVTTAPSR